MVIISILLNIFFLVLFLMFCYRFKRSIYSKLGIQLDKKIVMLGDSLIENGKWDKLLGRNDVQNSGIGGFTTSHFLWLLEDKVLKFKPSLCYLEGGINDIGVGIPTARTLENINIIIDKLLQNGIQVILQSVIYTTDAERNRIVDTLNSGYELIAKTKDIQYLDVNSVLSNKGMLKEEYSSDGTHITQKAYPAWAKIVAEHLRKMSI
jgi:alpha-glucosidase